MTTPTQHLEIFDEFSHCLHWELDKDKLVIDATPKEIKQHLIQTVIDVLEEQIEVIQKGLDPLRKEDTTDLLRMYEGRVLTEQTFLEMSRLIADVRQREVMKEVELQIDLLTTTLSTWKELL